MTYRRDRGVQHRSAGRPRVQTRLQPRLIRVGLLDYIWV